MYLRVTSLLEPQPGPLICLCIPEKGIILLCVQEKVAFGGMTCVCGGEKPRVGRIMSKMNKQMRKSMNSGRGSLYEACRKAII